MTIINYLTTIRFDFGALQGVADDLSQLKIKKPLIVTDAGLKAAGFVDRLCALLPDGAAAPVFDGTPTNPTETAVKAALAHYRASNCDAVIAIGGGGLCGGAAAAIKQINPQCTVYGVEPEGADVMRRSFAQGTPATMPSTLPAGSRSSASITAS